MLLRAQRLEDDPIEARIGAMAENNGSSLPKETVFVDYPLGDRGAATTQYYVCSI
jgi:hypothetical protein